MLNHSPTLLLSHRNDTHEEKNTASLHHLNDDKQAMEGLLAESKRLVKSVLFSPFFLFIYSFKGLYKKAFNVVENAKIDFSAMPPALQIKLCRRMIICVTRICDRYINKGDIQRIDHFIKLMNRSYDYLQGWYDNLATYISKTDPKYAHLQLVLDEVDDSFEDDLGIPSSSGVRIKIKNAFNPQNSSYLSTGDSRETRPSSFTNKLRQSALLTKGKATYLEDMSHMEMSRMNTEYNTNTNQAEINSKIVII